MVEALIVSQIILWIAVLVLVAIVVVLARQIGVLHERIAPAGALAMNAKLSVGDRAPKLRLNSLDGRRVDIGSETEMSTLVFFVSPDCPVCKSPLPIVKSSLRAERSWIKGVLASDGGNAALHRDYISSHDLGAIPYVVSEELGQQYGVSKLPYAALIDQKGYVRSLGMVNTREHIESLFNASEMGVASIQEYISKKRGKEAHNVKAG